MDKKYVCSQCFKNQGLKDVIKASKKDQGSCCFCSSAGKRLPIKAVISLIEKCIQREYEIRNPGTYNIKEVLDRVGFQAHIWGATTYIAKQLQGPSYCFSPNRRLIALRRRLRFSPCRSIGLISKSSLKKNIDLV